jgi:hypothetical protein
MLGTRSHRHFANLCFALMFLIAVSPAIWAQTEEQPKPGPEHKRLQPLVGEWSYQGEAQATPFGPAGKFAGKQSSRSVLNGFFVESRWEDTSTSGYAAQGMFLTGYDRAAQRYTDFSFENDGTASYGFVTIDGNRWTGTRNRIGRDGKTYKLRWSTDFSEDGMSTQDKQEYSDDDGKTWQPFFELTMSRQRD